MSAWVLVDEIARTYKLIRPNRTKNTIRHEYFNNNTGTWVSRWPLKVFHLEYWHVPDVHAQGQLLHPFVLCFFCRHCGQPIIRGNFERWSFSEGFNVNTGFLLNFRKSCMKSCAHAALILLPANITCSVSMTSWRIGINNFIFSENWIWFSRWVILSARNPDNLYNYITFFCIIVNHRLCLWAFVSLARYNKRGTWSYL